MYWFNTRDGVCVKFKLVLFILFLILVTGCASANVNIMSSSPLDPTPVVYSSINFTANFSEEGFFEWLVDGSVVQNGTADNTTYTFSAMLIDDFNITIRTADDQHSWALKTYEEGMQVVTAYTPFSSTPSATSGTVVEFTANLSEPGFYEWLVNGSVVQNGTATWGNLITSYDYTASSIGDFNITIRPENDQQEWLLSVVPREVGRWENINNALYIDINSSFGVAGIILTVVIGVVILTTIIGLLFNYLDIKSAISSIMIVIVCAIVLIIGILMLSSMFQSLVSG